MDQAAFSLNRIPEIRFGPGLTGKIAGDAALQELGVAATVASALTDAGAVVLVFSDIADDPKQRQVEAAAKLDETVAEAHPHDDDELHLKMADHPVC